MILKIVRVFFYRVGIKKADCQKNYNLGEDESDKILSREINPDCNKAGWNKPKAIEPIKWIKNTHNTKYKILPNIIDANIWEFP